MLQQLAVAVEHYRGETLARRRSLEAFLASAFRRSSESAEWCPLGEVAPIVRRPVVPVEGEGYPELGIRSFGKGTFHKPTVTAEQLGTKRLFMIRSGDLHLSNVFSWEGAVAVATNADDGRLGPIASFRASPIQNARARISSASTSSLLRVLRH